MYKCWYVQNYVFFQSGVCYYLVVFGLHDGWRGRHHGTSQSLPAARKVVIITVFSSCSIEFERIWPKLI